MASNHPSRNRSVRHLTDEQLERIDRETTSRPCAVEGCPCRETIVPHSRFEHPQPQSGSKADAGYSPEEQRVEDVHEEEDAEEEARNEDAQAGESSTQAAGSSISRPLRERLDFEDVQWQLDFGRRISTNLYKVWNNAREKVLAESGPELTPAHRAPIICANPGCVKRGKQVCTKCLLVAYCGKECQVRHWKRTEKSHKIDCNCFIAKKDWKPQWESDNRPPSFQPTPSLEIWSLHIHPWGNYPAYDLLKLASNEGLEYKKELSILLADAQDFRHTLKTILHLPSTFKSSLKFTINDCSFHFAARQIFTLCLLRIEDPAVAADVISHVWYSAFLREDQLELIEQYVRPVLGALQVPPNAKDEDVVPFHFKLGQGNVGFYLKLRQWHQFATLFIRDLGRFEPHRPRRTAGPAHMQDHDQRSWQVDVKNRLHLALGVRTDHPYYEQLENRHTFMMHDIDSHDRALTEIRAEGQLHQRLSRWVYMCDGMLLPYGAGRSNYTEYNPTLWYLGYHWRVSDTADPLYAWSPRLVRKAFSSWSSTTTLHNDLYGQLSVYLRGAIAETHVRLRYLPISFDVRTSMPKDLAATLSGTHFDRIDAGNPDGHFREGLPATLGMLGGLLNPANSRATLITQVTGLAEDASVADAADTSAMFRGAAAFLRTPFFSVRPGSAEAQLYDRARTLFAPVRAWLERRLAAVGADGAAAEAGLARARGAARVVELCPFAMGAAAAAAEEEGGAQAEFDDRLAMRSSVDGTECFVEWARVVAPADEDAAASMARLRIGGK